MSVMRWNSDLIDNLTTAYPAGGWVGDAGPSTRPDAIAFDAVGGFGNTAFQTGAAKAEGPKLTVLVSFNGADGANPGAGLITDAAGDLLGTTDFGGADNDGTVFGVAKTKGGYAGAPTTLVSFTGADGSEPSAALTTDAAGDLFGVTLEGGLDSAGVVFEIAKTKSGYAGAPKTLVSFTGADGNLPSGSLIADANGDLFGTTAAGGVDGAGVVFEIARTKNGYARAPTDLVSFTTDDGYDPNGSLIADAAGDLFGVTAQGGANGDGTVFEIAKTKLGYASAPTTLVSFNGDNGNFIIGGLIADKAGDLFGEAYTVGVEGDGTVFEIVKTKHGYANTPTILVSFNGGDGANPSGKLIADAAGDLFGMTVTGGADDDGTVFEIAKTKLGYAGAPTTLATFTGDNGANPFGSLIADKAGDLFGTTYSSGGGPDGEGTVFEITNSGFVTADAPAAVAPAGNITRSSPLNAAFVQAMASHSSQRSGSSSLEIRAVLNDTPMLLSRPHTLAQDCGARSIAG